MKLEHIVRSPTGDRKPIPVLLLHGAWHGAWCYDQWLDDFAAHGYETHAFSLPGHGGSESDRLLNLYGMGDYVAALTEIVAGITPTPFVVGHSMGGYILQWYLRLPTAQTLPGGVLLASIPTVGAVPFYVSEFIKNPPLMLLAGLTLNLKLLVNTRERFAQSFLAPESADIADRYYQKVQNESARVALEVATPILNSHRIKTPILVVAGEKDTVFPLPRQQRTAKAYNAELYIAKNQGHDLMIERDNSGTAAAIREWFERQTAERKSEKG